MQYMRAHGNTPGPTQRPLAAGAISAAAATVPGGVLLWISGAVASFTQELRFRAWLVLVLYVVAMCVAGLLYGRIFGRAANDKRGGWLFGISYGFLVWMVGPVTALQLIRGRPIATGAAAIGLLAAHLIFGLGLGLLFPWIHKLLQRRLGDLDWVTTHGWYGTKRGLPTAPKEEKR